MNKHSTVHQQESVAARQMSSCPLCAGHAKISPVTEALEYTTPKGIVTISVTMPYITCDACGFAGFGEAGERARTEAVYRYHGRLTPWNIVEIRTSLGLTQAEFAHQLGVGHASLERWETGEKMQNQSMDNLIILLSNLENKAWLEAERSRRLRRSVAQSEVVDFYQFRALSQQDQAELRARSTRFRLRR